MIPADIVRLEKVWVSYNGTPALEDVDLTVSQHDFLGVIGPNGGGKSTLLKVMLGLIRPQRGLVTVLGKPPELSRGSIGYVPQYSNYDHNFPASAMEVVLMGRFGKRGMLKPYNGEDREAAEKALERVGMLSHARAQIGQLSGGQQQRILIARALVSDPALLLLDEPTASVDSAMQTDFYQLLEDLKNEMAIVMVSHDIGAVSVFVDKIACLNVRLYYHGPREITQDILEATYKCPVQLIAHGDIPHRVLMEH